MFIKSENLTRFGRLIDGEFPDYVQVIPNGTPKYATVDRLKLFQAIKRIMLMSGKNYLMKFEFWPHSLTLLSCTPEFGDASEEIEAEFMSNGLDKRTPFAIGFNGKYILDMLEVLDGERVTIGIDKEVSPVKVDDGDSVHIIMPLRLAEVESEPESALKSGPEHEPDLDPEFIEEEEMG